MDDLFNSIMHPLYAAMAVDEVKLPPELALTRYPLGALELSCRNWRSVRFNKIYAMRMKVKVPSLNILGMAFQPAPCYDIPLFMFDISCTKKKIIFYSNVLATASGDAYFERYIAPFEKIKEQHTGLHSFKMPDWMQVYRNGATIYVDPEPGRLAELKAIVQQYFTEYLRLAAAAEKITDPGRLAAIARFHETFKNDLVTKDRSQIMLGKVIGREKAGRIFREVLT